MMAVDDLSCQHEAFLKLTARFDVLSPCVAAILLQ